MEHNALKSRNQIPEQDMVNWMLTIAENERKTDDPSSPMLVGGSTSPARRFFWLLGDNKPPQKLSSRAFGVLRRKAIASGYRRQSELGYPSLQWDQPGQDSYVDVCFEKGIFQFQVKPPTGEFEYFASWGRLCGRGNKGYISILNGKQSCRRTEFSIS